MPIREIRAACEDSAALLTRISRIDSNFNELLPVRANCCNSCLFGCGVAAPGHPWSRKLLLLSTRCENEAVHHNLDLLSVLGRVPLEEPQIDVNRHGLLGYPA